jgi:hypothetical protein
MIAFRGVWRAGRDIFSTCAAWVRFLDSVDHVVVNQDVEVSMEKHAI